MLARLLPSVLTRCCRFGYSRTSPLGSTGHTPQSIVGTRRIVFVGPHSLPRLAVLRTHARPRRHGRRAPPRRPAIRNESPCSLPFVVFIFFYKVQWRDQHSYCAHCCGGDALVHKIAEHARKWPHTMTGRRSKKPISAELGHVSVQRRPFLCCCSMACCGKVADRGTPQNKQLCLKLLRGDAEAAHLTVRLVPERREGEVGGGGQGCGGLASSARRGCLGRTPNDMRNEGVRQHSWCSSHTCATTY